MNDLSRASPPVQGIFHMFNQTWYLSKITPLDFQAKKFTLLISPNFNSFRDKNTKMSVYGWRNLHRWQIFYTPAGKDGRDKSHLCVPRFSFIFAHKNRWLLGWKLQGGLFTKRRCAVPDFAASFQHFHCLETLREHFVLILLFRGITNISRIWLILRAVSRTKKMLENLDNLILIPSQFHILILIQCLFDLYSSRDT